MRARNVSLSGKTVLVTGAAGFIGSRLVLRLFRDFADVSVVGIDSMSDYYDPACKERRLAELEHAAPEGRWTMLRGDMADSAVVHDLLARFHPAVAVHLAAQPGVRYGVTNPDAYIQSNVLGFYHLLEACRHDPVAHLVYASSSSVYGARDSVPFRPEDRTDTPASLYAATKKTNELMAYTYASLYGIPSTGLRFFTVYGPAGRPDMFYYTATQRLERGERLQLFNRGDCQRDFTYIDDVIEGLIRVLPCAPERKSGANGLSIPPHAVYNLGRGMPVSLTDFVRTLHAALVEAGILPKGDDLSAHLELVDAQPGDVPVTCADVSAFARDFGFTPGIGIEEGLRRFAAWYRAFGRGT